MSYVRIAAILATILLWFATGCDFNSNPSTDAENPNTPTEADSSNTEKIAEVLTDTFGIEIDNLEIKEDNVRRGDTFTRILERQGMSRSEAHNLSQKIRPDFNVRRVVTGRTMRFYHHEDNSELKHIIYPDSRLNYTHIDLSQEEPIVEKTTREPETRLRYAEGHINSSLYQTLQANGHSTDLAYTLSQVFAWQLDFHRIRQGDEFRIVYEEHLLDGEHIGIGDIKVAQINHRNNNYFAFRYEDEGDEYYYDEEGNSLRRSYKKAPVQYSRITSRFTDNRYHPVLGRNMPHHGVDYAAPTGTPVYAVGDGTITRAHYDQNNGNFVRIRHNSVHESGYLHLNGFASGIRSGVEVEQGDVIGYVGSTGLATGPHVCYRFWENGNPVNPLNVDADPVDPLAEEYMDDYEDHILSLMKLMQELPDQEKSPQDTQVGILIQKTPATNLIENPVPSDS